MLLPAAPWTNAARHLPGPPANTTSTAHSITSFSSFGEIDSEEFKAFVATGASDEEVAKWIEEKAKRRPRIEIIKWNNDFRYKRLSEMPDGIQEFMEDYIPQFVPPHLRHHVDYFFDIYDAEEKRM